jgi:membrane associated rhomboid family serine protease/Zn-finger nucleic acid-binding protein
MNQNPQNPSTARSEQVLLSCPNCDDKLVSTSTEKGTMYGCPRCEGKAVSVAVLRKILGVVFVRNLWVKAKAILEGKGKDCPECSRPMCDVVTSAQQGEAHVNVCTRCQIVWFEARDLEAMPEETVEPKKQLSLKAREAIGLAQLELDKKRQELQLSDEEAPDEQWKLIPAVFGMPVKMDGSRNSAVPWVTWGLGAALIIAFLSTVWDISGFAEKWGMIPAERWRYGGLTLLTCFFLHVNFWHLVSNLYFFVTFGDNVEEDLGRKRFAILLLLATLLGNFAQIALDPKSNIPCIGASGGISGVLVYYALRFPRARLGIMTATAWTWRIPWIGSARWVRFPAWTALVFWIVLQLYVTWLQAAKLTHVSGMAHLGGSMAGLGAWLFWKFGANPVADEQAELD